MEAKKNPELDLHRKSPLFLAIGFIVSCITVITAFEWQFLRLEPIGRPEVEPDNWVAIIDNPPVVDEPEKKQNPKPVKAVITVEDPTPIEQAPKELENFLPELPTNTGPVVFNLPVEPEPIKDEPYIVAEVMPLPIDGYKEFYRELAKSIRYPKAAIRNEVEGKVFVEFVVNKDGKITDLKVLTGIGSGCDEEALRVIAKSNWMPGKQRGKPVNVRMVIPIYFNLK